MFVGTATHMLGATGGRSPMTPFGRCAPLSFLVDRRQGHEGWAVRLCTFAAPAAVSAVGAQSPLRKDSTRADSSRSRMTSLSQVTITATRTEKDVFDTPSAVSVIDSATLGRRLPNTPVDAFRDLPGLDVTGVGTNQTRPTIRGLGGNASCCSRTGSVSTTRAASRTSESSPPSPGSRASIASTSCADQRRYCMVPMRSAAS